MPSRFRFADDANCGDFTLLFCIGRLRNVQSFKTHVLSYCSANQIFFFFHVLAVFAVEVCLRSLLTENRALLHFYFESTWIQWSSFSFLTQLNSTINRWWLPLNKLCYFHFIFHTYGVAAWKETQRANISEKPTRWKIHLSVHQVFMRYL